MIEIELSRAELSRDRERKIYIEKEKEIERERDRDRETGFHIKRVKRKVVKERYKETGSGSRWEIII